MMSKKGGRIAKETKNSKPDEPCVHRMATNLVESTRKVITIQKQVSMRK